MPPIGLEQALDKGTDHVEGVEVSDIEMAADLIKRKNNRLITYYHNKEELQNQIHVFMVNINEKKLIK